MRRLTTAGFFAGIFFFILVSVDIAAYAAPASHEPAYFVQPDGTVVQVNVIGDEFLGWTEDADADLIIFDIDLNGYCYAVWTDDGPVSTGELVGSPDRGISSAPGSGMGQSRTRGRDVSERLRERANGEREAEMAILLSAGNMPPETELLSDAAPERAGVSSLKRNLLIIHATWSDRTGINTPKLNGNQIYDRVFNPAVNSVNRYYKELIGATEDIILPAAVKNPLNGRPGIIEVTLPGSHTNPGNNSDNRRALMTSVLTAASALGYVDFSVFDTNRDRTLQTTELSIGVIIDGYESSSSAVTSKSFWGSAGSGYSPSSSLTNNVKIESAFGVGAFHGTSGNTVSDMLTIGIICHELGHSAYRFIDTYDTQTTVNDGETQGHGYWSLMAQGSWSRKSNSESGGSSPSYVDAYNLVMYGFVTPGVISGYTSNITLNSHLDIYRVNTDASAGQYFLLQQRKYGSADNYDRGAFYRINTSSNSGTGGLLIYHIDKNVTSGNSKNSHYLAAIAEAHGGQQHLRTVRGTTGANYGDLDDLWGGRPYQLFSDTSDPSAKLYSAYTSNTVPPTKNTNSGIGVGNITWNGSAGNTMFYVAHGGSANCCSADTLNSLQSAINEYAHARDDMVITVTADFPINSGLLIPENEYGKTLTIKSANAATPFTLTRGFSDVLFTVNGGVKLIFEDIIVDGNKDMYQGGFFAPPIVQIEGGEFTMKDGAVLTNNSNSGVHVYSGVFIMTGGEIRGNTTMFVGGVYVSGYFDPLNGSIALQGEFIMTGGKISGNTASSLLCVSGGVYVDNAGMFTMTGGEINNNTAEFFGGGVLIDEGGVFALGGTAAIRGNINNNVYLSDGAYITLGAGGNGVAAPAPGMEIWVTKTGDNGVIVASGARSGDVAYFFADTGGGKIIYEANRLHIILIPFIYGDLDGDGEVTPLDLVQLRRWLANWSGIKIDVRAADVDADGAVTPHDLVVLRRHLAKWNGYETLPYMEPSPSPVMAMASSLLSGDGEEEVTLVDATPSASVKKLKGNKNDLTVTVTERYSDGSTNTITSIISINNNAAGNYQVGRHIVYVETKGSDKIRQCYIINYGL